MLEPKNEINNNPISTILGKLSTINETSNLIPVITYPIIECYLSWKNIFIKEYPIRSTIRAVISTGAFVTGPLLTQVANFTWFKDRCNGLYQTIPIFNLLPEEVGTAICSAYVCGYFLTWSGIQITDIYNNYKFGGIYHYLTDQKVQQIHEFITNNNFNITPEEITQIFNKINLQLNKNPNNPILNNMILALRKGDFQTILDHAHLLETEIAIVNNKLNRLLAAEQLNYAPAVINNNLLHDNSIETLPEDDALLTENSSEGLDVSENNSNRPNADPQANNIRYNNTPPSEEENPDRNQPPITAILYQYQNKFKSKNKSQIISPIDNLKEHKAQLKAKRFITPNKSFLNN